jgi:hypothetical protein
LKLSWNNGRPASPDFNLEKRNKGTLRLRRYLKSQNEAGSSSLHEKQSCGDNMGLISLKIGWDLARALLVFIALMVLPLDFLNSGSNGNNIGNSFRHFWLFFHLLQL